VNNYNRFFSLHSTVIRGEIDFILGLQWGRSVIATLWRTNQGRKHHILCTADWSVAESQ